MNEKVIKIKVNKVEKKFKSVQALDHLSVELRSGTLHGLIGPEGAGKTTLLRIIMKLIEINVGKVEYTYNSKDIPFIKFAKIIGYMPEGKCAYPDLSVNDNLEFIRDLYSIPRKKYEIRKKNLLKVASLTKFTTTLADNLSGGMYKKLGLICTLLHSPRVILLDEPTVGVDPVSRLEFWEILYKLSASNNLVMITSSSLTEAWRCNKISLIDNGKIIAEGTPKDLEQGGKYEDFSYYFNTLEKKYE